MCPQQYFFEYVLGHKQTSGHKADKGTIVHKVLELCGACKKALQDGQTHIVDNIVGQIETAKYEEQYLDFIIDTVYQYYSVATPHHKWKHSDLEACRNWVWKTLRYGDGMFDPRNRVIVDTEVRFDIPINEPWSSYEYDINGKIITGNLHLKGTIDLVMEVSPTIYEAQDYKTGQRKDWATDKVKNEPDLYKDAQLRIYHLALKHLYPNIREFLLTINFINDGGPYTIFLEDKDMAHTLEVIGKMFERIKGVVQPELKRTWKCSKLCDFGKQTFDGTNIEPMIETRPFKQTRTGHTMTKCEQVKYEMEKHGIDWTMRHYTAPGFSVDQYDAPGEV